MLVDAETQRFDRDTTPPGWTQHTSKSNGKVYYFNKDMPRQTEQEQDLHVWRAASDSCWLDMLLFNFRFGAVDVMLMHRLNEFGNTQPWPIAHCPWYWCLGPHLFLWASFCIN